MKAYVGLGSNLGEREVHMKAALEELTHLPETRLGRVSSIYDTAPVGDLDQPNFLNAVAQLETDLTARQLLWNLLLVERRLGRVRSASRRFGPRVIDLTCSSSATRCSTPTSSWCRTRSCTCAGSCSCRWPRSSPRSCTPRSGAPCRSSWTASRSARARSP